MSSILSKTSQILFAIISNSFSFIPRAVNAGLPILIPLVTNGLLVSPGTVFLFTVIPAFPKAAKAVAFKEILDPSWKDYAKQVKANAKILGEVLIKRGYDLVSGGTDNHLVLVSFLNKPFSGKDADAALGNAGITVNKNTVPGETRSPFVTSGIRIGSPALTARGMKEKEFEIIANKICDVLDNIEDTTLHAKIKKELEELAGNFVVYNQSTF